MEWPTKTRMRSLGSILDLPQDAEAKFDEPKYVHDICEDSDKDHGQFHCQRQHGGACTEGQRGRHRGLKAARDVWNVSMPHEVSERQQGLLFHQEAEIPIHQRHVPFTRCASQTHRGVEVGCERQADGPSDRERDSKLPHRASACCDSGKHGQAG